MDFSRDEYIQSLAGGHDLTYLLSHSFEGVMQLVKYPLMKVL